MNRKTRMQIVAWATFPFIAWALAVAYTPRQHTTVGKVLDILCILSLLMAVILTAVHFIIKIHQKNDIPMQGKPGSYTWAARGAFYAYAGFFILLAYLIIQAQCQHQ